MAKKKIIIPAPKEPPKLHQDCVHAYGHCYRAADGSPISCRCLIHGEVMKVCREKGCPDWEKRSTPVPFGEQVPIGPSENRHPELIPRKVVPLFDPEGDPREPVQVVWADTLPHNACLYGAYWKARQEREAKEEIERKAEEERQRIAMTQPWRLDKHGII